jgi:hypothetical protein
MRKLITAVLTVATFFLMNITSIYADGNPYGPYQPYQPHKPIPTGFDDTSIFYITAGILFIIGMSVLATVKNLKAKHLAN